MVVNTNLKVVNGPWVDDGDMKCVFVCGGNTISSQGESFLMSLAADDFALSIWEEGGRRIAPPLVVVVVPCYLGRITRYY